jgi:hypothetical protein
MPPSLLPPTPEELEELRQRRRASQLKGYGQGADDPAAQALLDVRRNLGEAGRAAVGAKPYDETNPTGSYRAVQALMNAPTPAAIIPEMGQAVGKAAGALSGLGALGVVKPKGGNWLAGSVERGLTQMKQPDRMLQGGNQITLEQALNWPGLAPEAGRNLAINNWIDTKVNKYIRNELGTPEDPVRALAERGILHFTPQGGAVSAHTNRQILGMPTDPTATSLLAQSWENVADATIRGAPYRMHLPMVTPETAPDELRKLGGEYAVQNPNALAYELNRGTPVSEGLGFRHLIDELRNATNPNSGLPASLRLTPQQLEKVTVPQAVERVAKINEWRAAQKAEADALKARNPATFEHRAYETVPGTTEPNEKGLRWVELKLPEIKELPPGYSVKPMSKEGRFAVYGPDGRSTGAVGRSPEEAIANQQVGRQPLEDALKYEGETMGHCVGGYCPDVIEGRSRIYSLRDKKGEPHVTIEVRPSKGKDKYYTDWVKAQPENVQDEITAAAIEYNAKNPKLGYGESLNKILEGRLGPVPDEIIQIKGKANRAPKDEYLPFVQDFVRSGQWSTVGDLQNTGLMTLRPEYNKDLVDAITKAGGTAPYYVTKEELDNLVKTYLPDQSYAHGGAVELKGGGHPPIESRRKASDLPGYGQGSTGALGDVVRGFMGEKPAEPTNPSELFRLAQALGAFPPVAGVVKGAKGVKSLGEMIDREVRKVRRMEELGKGSFDIRQLPSPTSAEVTGWHVTQDLPGVLQTGALTNRNVGANNLQGWAPAHVGGAYFYSHPSLAKAQLERVAEDMPEMVEHMPILRAQLRKGNRLVPDEDVGLRLPWQKSFEEGSFATTRPVMMNQIDRIYAEDPDLIKDIIRDTAVRQRRYKKGGAVTDPNEPEVKRLPEPGLLTATMYAETAAREMYPKDPVKRDAARHMIASSILGQKLSPGTSRLLGELYEFKTSPLLHLKSAVGLGAPPPGYEMDKFNNALGSEMQFRNQAELQRGVRQAVDTGRARLTPDEPAPYRRGGAVKIETNPTLMADELLFKGYRR